MFDVVGVGANSVDQVLIIPGEIGALVSSGKMRFARRHLFCGGQTATTLAACAALGMRSRYLGCFGSDDYGRMIRTELQRRGVDVRHALDTDAPNADAVIVVDADGHRTVLWDRNESLRLEPDLLHPGILAARIVHVDDVDQSAALRACRMAREADTPVTSDIDQVNDGTEELISSVTYPILAHDVPTKLTAESDPERALRKLRRLNRHLLCMTLGDRGAVALEGDCFHVAPAVKVKVVDDTGAGDVFRAGFIYGLLQGWDVPQLLRFANAAAAVSCTRLGAIPSVPSLEEVQDLLKVSSF
jgi:sulfofructose kinase